MPNYLQLTSHQSAPDYTESMAYDLSSNPVRIRRRGITEVPANTLTGTLRFGMCDDIALTYSGLRLVKAENSAPACYFSGAMDFADGASSSVEYTYDAVGNMLSDANSGPFEYRGGKLSRVNFPGGYISGDSACHYIHDNQYNVRQVVEAGVKM